MGIVLWFPFPAAGQTCAVPGVTLVVVCTV